MCTKVLTMHLRRSVEEHLDSLLLEMVCGNCVFKSHVSSLRGPLKRLMLSLINVVWLLFQEIDFGGRKKLGLRISAELETPAGSRDHLPGVQAQSKYKAGK